MIDRFIKILRSINNAELRIFTNIYLKSFKNIIKLL